MDEHKSRTAWLKFSFTDVPHDTARVMWATNKDEVKGSTTGTLVLDIDDRKYTYDNIIHLWYRGLRMYQHLPDRAYRLLAAAVRQPPFLQPETWRKYEPAVTEAFETGEFFDAERFSPGAKSALSAAVSVSPRAYDKHHAPENVGPAAAMASLRYRGTWQMSTILDAYDGLDADIVDIEQEFIQLRQKVRADMLPFVVDPLKFPHPDESLTGTRRNPQDDPLTAQYDE